jgi:YgiT-type zinc finger domain-containing protein
MKCTKCFAGETEIGTTSITYQREGSSIRVTVDGIPAEICPVCGEVYLSDSVAQQIFNMVNPILEVGRDLNETTVLPAPTVDIHFPPLAPAELKRALAV